MRRFSELTPMPPPLIEAVTFQLALLGKARETKAEHETETAHR